jgi:hypothetical protein
MAISMIDGILYSHRGRIIGPKNGCFPSFREIFYGLSNLPRFAGQGERPRYWNVLKHSVCVALLMGKIGAAAFIAGLFHDQAENWVGDVPTTFKPPIIRDFERNCQRLLLTQFTQNWRGFDPGAHVAHDYKHADMIMLDVESRLSLRPDHETYLQKFHYPKMTEVERLEAEGLFKALHLIQNDDLEELLRLCMTGAMAGFGQESPEAHTSITRLGRIIFTKAAT